MPALVSVSNVSCTIVPYIALASAIRNICTLPEPQSTVGNTDVQIMVTSVHWLGDALLASYLFHGILWVSSYKRDSPRIDNRVLASSMLLAIP